MAVSAEQPHPPFLRSKPSSGGIQRLDVTLRSGQRSPDDSALNQLSAAGLCWRRGPEAKALVIGGTGTFEGSGIPGYERAFAIKAGSDHGYIVAVAGMRGFPHLELQVATVAEAVDTVISTYTERGLIQAARMR